MNTYAEFIEEDKKRKTDFENEHVVHISNRKQFDDFLQQKNMTENDFCKSYCALSSNSYLPSDQVLAYNQILKSKSLEKDKLIAADHDGKHFVKDMFLFGMERQHYLYDRDLQIVFSELNITEEDLEKDSNLQAGLNAALDDVKLYDEFADLCNGDLNVKLYNHLKELPDNLKQDFCHDMNDLFNRRVFKSSVIDFDTFHHVGNSFIDMLIEDPQNEIISKYELDRPLNDCLNRINEILTKTDFPESIIDDDLKSLTDNLNGIKDLMSGKKKFITQSRDITI